MLNYWRERWPDFAPYEVLSPQGQAALKSGIVLVQEHAMDKLQDFRDTIEQPIIVCTEKNQHRGWRSFVENVKVGGETHSYHMEGLAFDLTVPGMSVDELFRVALAFGWSGVGKYPKRGFVHVDMRPLLGRKQITWEK